MKTTKKINILILVGGPVRKLDEFKMAASELGIDFTAASFNDVNYSSEDENLEVKVGERTISEFDIIYFRMVGKRIEDATIVANFAKSKNIPVVDRLYTKELLYPSSISKAHETMKLIEAGVPMPRTIYGSLKYLKEVAPKVFGYPFVFKSTTGKKAREVWSPSNPEELEEIYQKTLEFEKNGSRFFAQEFVKASNRYRVFILGGEAVACVAQPTKWRKRFNEEEVEKGFVDPMPADIANIAKLAAKAADLDISGVDVLKEDETGRLLVIEANAAPSWNLIKKHTPFEVEKEILKWLIKQV